MGDNQHPDTSRDLALGHAVDTGRVGSDLPRQLLEILGGDRPPAGAQQQGSAGLRVGQGLGLGAADRRRAILHPGDVRHRGLQYANGAAGDIAALAATGSVRLQAAASHQAGAPRRN